MPIDIEKYVSPETYEKIIIYADKVSEWNERINLIQEDTVKDLINRHVLDSLQIIPIIHEIQYDNQTSYNSDTQPEELIPKIHPLHNDMSQGYKFDEHFEELNQYKMIDVGTGAGFPGMILAICGLEGITLCDTNKKKCIFLEEVSRLTKTKVKILNQDIEYVEEKFDYIISRAYTSFKSLLNITNTLSRDKSSYGIYHKGRLWKNELIECMKYWKFDINIYQSITSADSVIIICKNIQKK